ncbi:hypothetical protein ABMJ52_004723 [Escherichia coli]
MKTGSISLSGLFDFFQSTKNCDLHHNIEKNMESGKKISANSCYNIALFITEADGEITSRVRKSIQNTLSNGYSPKYREMMNIGENTLNHFFDISDGKSGFVNFVNKSGELCHTAYIKKSAEGAVYYHANYSCIDKTITDICGLDCMEHINNTNIIFYTINDEILSILTRFMQENQWRVAFCPADTLQNKGCSVHQIQSFRPAHTGLSLCSLNSSPGATPKSPGTNYIIQLFLECRGCFLYLLYSAFKNFIYVLIMCTNWVLVFV